MQARTLLVILLIVVAGCSGATQSSEQTETPTPTTTTKATTVTTDATQTPTPTATTNTPTTTVRTTEAPPSNPWRTETVVVAIEHYNSSSVPPLYVEAVRNATAYWNDAYSQYSPYEDVNFLVNVNATDPDIVVSIVEDVTVCGLTSDESYIGCADTYDAGEVADKPSDVDIEAGYTPASTTATIRHEFGHLLGLEHGDEPMPIMAASQETVAQSLPNATERAYPWLDENLSVAITGSPSAQQRDQIHAALQYIEDGADGLLTETTPSFTMTSNATQADIVIKASPNEWACGKEYTGGSCYELLGFDEDTDAALEYHSRLTITLAATNDETTAYHVAYWLAVGMGATPEEMPAPIDGEDDEPRTEWWR